MKKIAGNIIILHIQVYQKSLGDVIILHMCTKNHNLMMYGS